jgi:hypothetical protein
MKKHKDLMTKNRKMMKTVTMTMRDSLRMTSVG